jgi:tellurite resistance protein
MKIGQRLKLLTLGHVNEQLAFILRLGVDAAQADGAQNEKEMQALHRVFPVHL